MRVIKVMIVLVCLSILFVMGCGGSGQAAPKGPNKLYYPEWWQTQTAPDMVMTYGMSVKISQNMSYDAAYSDAMLQAAQYVETHVKGLIKNYEEESGVTDPQVLALTSKIVKVVSDAKFSHVKVTKQETIRTDDNRFQTFVQVSIPANEINKNMMSQIKNEEALYNQFKASQAFQELDKELSK